VGYPCVSCRVWVQYARMRSEIDDCRTNSIRANSMKADSMKTNRKVTAGCGRNGRRGKPRVRDTVADAGSRTDGDGVRYGRDLITTRARSPRRPGGGAGGGGGYVPGRRHHGQRYTTVVTSYSSVAGDQNASTFLSGASLVTGYPMFPCLSTLTSTFGTACYGPSNSNAIVVRQKVSVPLFFLRIFGSASVELNSTATASMRGQRRARSTWRSSWIPRGR